MKSWLGVAVLLVILIGITEAAEITESKTRQVIWRIPYQRADRKPSNYVKFYLYTRELLKTPEVVDSRDPKPFKNLKPDKPTKVTIHGWNDCHNCSFTVSMRRVLLRHLDINLITVDWSGHGTRTLYHSALLQAPVVGRMVAVFLELLDKKRQIKLQSLHILGHSLGGHIAGIVGKKVKSEKIGRITGFDPPGPHFISKYRTERLTTESAQFVDVIHSSTLGFSEPFGHVDFYPNGGDTVQPGCGLDIVGFCSHKRSYEYYLESIGNPEGYPAIACDDWIDFVLNTCDSKDIAYMGEKARNKSAHGKYYLQTNRKAPFLRKQSGIRYSLIYN